MERKNTLLLTVIAIATLLVAVVGATFAFFTASGSAADASEVNVITRSVDTTNTTATDVTMEITPEDMLLANGNNDMSVYKDNTDASIMLENTVGTGGGTRTCSYNITYTPRTNGIFLATGANTTDMKEFTIQATAAITGTGTSSVTSIAEYDLSDATVGDTAYNLNGSTPITFTTVGSVGSEISSSITWTFEVRFYNLGIDQTEIADNQYGGALTFEAVNADLCTTVAP